MTDDFLVRLRTRDGVDHRFRLSADTFGEAEDRAFGIMEKEGYTPDAIRVLGIDRAMVDDDLPVL